MRGNNSCFFPPHVDYFHRPWSLLLDFSNAFNNICREAMFLEFRKHIPSLSPWMEFCYSGQPLLHLGKNTIHSCCGVQQGDPLGPPGFALTLHPIIKRIKANVPGLALNAWYLDYGTLMGQPRDLVSALHIIEQDGPLVGLQLNRGKSLLFIPEEADASTLPSPQRSPPPAAAFPSLALLSAHRPSVRKYSRRGSTK